MAAQTLSIIVPVLNESAALPRTLEVLAPLLASGAELIVADGGSNDGSRAIARSHGAQVITAPRGRALQMNAGARNARGDVLLFLHADTVLPAQAAVRVQQALQPRPTRQARAWGRFDVTIEGEPRMLRVIAALMNARSRLTGIATGDQALFMTRAAFDAVSGFAAQPLMEDIDICRKLLKLSRPACLRDKVITSGRRWESRGVWRTIWLMWRLRFAYWLGAAPEQLARLYR